MFPVFVVVLAYIFTRAAITGIYTGEVGRELAATAAFEQDYGQLFRIWYAAVVGHILLTSLVHIYFAIWIIWNVI